MTTPLGPAAGPSGPFFPGGAPVPVQVALTTTPSLVTLPVGKTVVISGTVKLGITSADCAATTTDTQAAGSFAWPGPFTANHSALYVAASAGTVTLTYQP